MNAAILSRHDSGTGAQLRVLDNNIVEASRAGWRPPITTALESFLQGRALPPGKDYEALRQFNATAGGGQEGKLILPGGIFTRDLGSSLAAAGGVTVGTSVTDAAPALRARSVVLSLGARIVSGLNSDLSVPIVASGAPLEWLAEAAAITSEVEPEFSVKNATPRRAGGFVRISRQLLTQSPRVAAQAVETELLGLIGDAIDRAALAGTGIGPQPRGLFNDPAVGTTTIGGPLDAARLATMERQLGDANADRNLGFSSTPAVREKLRGVPVIAGPPPDGGPVWAGVEGAEYVLGWPAVASNNIPGDRIALGYWPDLAVLIWSLEILINPFSQILEGTVLIVCHVLMDVVVVRPESFIVSIDSGAQ